MTRLLAAVVLGGVLAGVSSSAQAPTPNEIDFPPIPALAVGTASGSGYSPVIFIKAGETPPPNNAVHEADFIARKVGCSGKGSACDYPVQVWKIQ